MLLWLLCLLKLSILQEYSNIFVFAQTCPNLKFPVTLGYDSGETEIFSVDLDASTGFIYLGGTSTAKELKYPGASKSVFTALFDGLKFVWISIIGSVDVDTFEYMSAMGETSPYLVLYATKSNDLYVPLIFTIDKIDGSIVRAVDIIDPDELG